ncbi:MAG: peptidoglycan-associated lipoprotein Pal [Pseudomonadota bacterium]
MFSKFSKSLAVAVIASVVVACSGQDDVNSTVSGGQMDGKKNHHAHGHDMIKKDSLAYFQQKIGDKTYFGYDQYTLTGEAQQTLASQADWIRQYAAGNMITVEGHADERGTREYNMALGLRRAHSIRSFLVSRGIPQSQIKTVSFGKERPEVEGSTPSAWAQNRRGVTTIR